MYPKDYTEYLFYFHCLRDYFECHEVLEEFWKEQPNHSRDDHWVGLIQIAVSLYHHRRGNFNGAKKMMNNAIINLSKKSKEIEKLGLDSKLLIETLREHLQKIENKIQYESINLPIKDDNLLQICNEMAEKQNLSWGRASDLSNEFLVNKHTLRDRSDVIETRKEELNKRKNNS
ncbi:MULTISPECIES: DUF309 domain-containing protein [Sutcliffiella]|uniref:DUF309 domain-containing protein n=1 Tax=Sutcliffiella cohnii TaxID=33932 RepID=A0A223KSI4_9BACI|nr:MULTISPECIES: DUF309 domain-containing protein [Sutcliffiella]AST92304.1 hypothetical protein BC6307_13915 [Sutcliffiella cohnii]WBL13535.1 DUF309 domain-containing protein [Sutcliffiella sp. NC1]